jgi:TPR repeat protein
VKQALSLADRRAAGFNRALRCASDTEAFESLLRAAESGCLRAQFLVGLACHTGRGVAVDYECAAAWYRKAAGGGDSHAMANLGVMSLLGQRMPVDEVDAYAWVQSAVGMGHQWLRPVLDVLEWRITGREAAGDERILASVAPEMPALGPCLRLACDPSRCDVV